MKLGFRFWGFLVTAAFILPISKADEGMWLYNNLPKKSLKEKHNFEPTDAWLDHVRLSSVRFNSGGSGSFVSEDGLVLTNHHVAADTVDKLAKADGKDYYHKGFFAKSSAEERKAADLELNQLESIEDVTARVNSVLTAKMSDAEASQARKAEIAKIEQESTAKTGLRSDVMTLYQGGQYHLYRYKKYTDVRLVFAPEYQIAFFGGDADNFEFPRYDLDVAFFRVYENNRPVKLKHFLKFAPSDKLKENDLVFVSGNPGSTRRQFTVSHLNFLRNVSIPYMVGWLGETEISLQQYGLRSVAAEKMAHKDLFSVQNSRKVYRGRIQSLQSAQLLTPKLDEELTIRQTAQNSAQLKAYAGAWKKIEQVQNEAEKVYIPYSLFEKGDGFNSQLFKIARALVRMAEEDTKEDSKRLEEFGDSKRESLKLALFSSAPLNKDYEAYKLGASLNFLARHLGKNPKYKDLIFHQMLAGKDANARAQELIQGTQIGDTAFRKKLAEGGEAAIEGTTDPLIRFAKLVDKTARELREEMETKVDEPQRQAYAQIEKVRFAVKGTDTYPDATFTLRLSYGTVTGYDDKGQKIAPFTDMGGAYAHAESHGSAGPYALPESWLKAKAQIKADTKYNFVSTCDIIGGNSGSPTLNRDGEFVGIIFDGNIHSLVADYFYSDVKSRAVSVHSAAILESLRNIYGAKSLADELTK